MTFRCTQVSSVKFFFFWSEKDVTSTTQITFIATWCNKSKFSFLIKMLQYHILSIIHCFNTLFKIYVFTCGFRIFQCLVIHFSQKYVWNESNSGFLMSMKYYSSSKILVFLCTLHELCYTSTVLTQANTSE
jgi:hypothetical protein